ncbi:MULTISPECIES: dynamin family protein [unclassified Streptomyces]|uniref:dynamin family protein n=1 Tax=unclassified Streptomyces TaxID=2593676 RepID=UPI002E2DD6DC|nr:dynamin family protein [Streptomyces sp. NBC_01439]
MTTEEGGYAAADAQRERLAEMCRGAQKAAEQIGNNGAVNDVAALLERIENQVFHVMVVGDFNRGKSTFVNALLGDRVLPVKAVPATAVITEVRFGESPAALLWTEDADEPEAVDPARLIELITVNNATGAERSPYVMAEVSWPLELCRHNVVLIDSPGLNAYATHDGITLTHLSKADAVIFLQHAIAPMSISESDFLEKYLSAYDPFFVFTYFDAIDDHERDDVVHSARRRITTLRGEDRDEGRFFFVDAKSALRARMAEDDGAFRRTGMDAVERQLERYLVTDRHKVKLLAPARTLCDVAQELRHNIPSELKMLESEKADLERNWTAAQQPVKELEALARQISLDIRNQTRELQDRVESLLGGFLTGIADEALPIAQSVDITTKLGMNPLKAKERAGQVADEIANGTVKAMEEKVALWVTGSLKLVIEQERERLAKRLNAELVAFDESLAKLRIELQGASGAAVGGDLEAQPLTRFLAGVGGWAIGGPAGVLVGTQFGAKEALRTVLPSLGVALAWLFTPFGLPTLVAAWIAQGFFQVNFAGDRVEKKMREEIGRAMATQLRIAAPTQAREAARAFAAETMEPLERQISHAMSSRIEELTRSVVSARAALDQGEEAVEQRRTELSRLDDLLSRVDEETGDLIAELTRM